MRIVEKEFVKLQEIVKACGVTDATIHNWILKGVTTPVKISNRYFYTRDNLKDLKEYADAHRSEIKDMQDRARYKKKRKKPKK